MKCYIIDLHSLKKEASKKILSRGTVFKCAGLTLVLLVGLPDISMAASSTGIDVSAEKIYRKVTNIGKWIIIIKGGIDSIQSFSRGDLHDAKKTLLGCALTYGVLSILPWGMDQIDELTKDMR